MTVIAKPVGRGNWAKLTIKLSGTRAQPLLVNVGDRFEMAGLTWRICKVMS